MFGRKVYGQSKSNSCPFCGRNALAVNKQGVPVCRDHRDQSIPEIKCACGGWLDLKQGKFGSFFTCSRCTKTTNFDKAMAENPIKPVNNSSTPKANNTKSSGFSSKSFTKKKIEFSTPKNKANLDNESYTDSDEFQRKLWGL